MSLGEDRVRVKFNPSANTIVDQIKQKTAELIDLCEIQRMIVKGLKPELVRVWDIAQQEYESAAHWAVKGATAEK